MSHLTSKLNIEHGSETWTLRAEVFGEFRNALLEENAEDKMVRESN